MPHPQTAMVGDFRKLSCVKLAPLAAIGPHVSPLPPAVPWRRVGAKKESPHFRILARF